jgi:CheY-specific phosphatase CheX
MNLNIIDIASSAMRAINKTLRNTCSVVLTEMPDIRQAEIISMKAMSPEGTFTSVMIFKNKEGVDVGLKGGLIVYIAKHNIKNLFGALGLNDMSPESEIKDMCGEFCNIAAGCFKTEIMASGYQNLDLSLPQNFYGVIYKDIDVKAITKYTFGFASAGKGLLTVDVFMESSA